MEGFEGPWWICGGWALDLFLRRETRRHDDLDIAILRRDQLALFQHLHDWDLRFATPDHRLVIWDGRSLEPPIHGVWARRSREADAPWTCEFLLNEQSGGMWTYRRNEQVSIPLDEIGLERGGVPFLRPEVVLLFKSAEPSPKADTDFANTLQALTKDERDRLRDALMLCKPEHPWISKLV